MNMKEKSISAFAEQQTIISEISERKASLIRNILVIAVATALSRIFGLIRDIVIADRFGAGAAYDAYIIAFTIPHLLRGLLAEGALSTAFVPIYTEYLTQKGKEAANRFANNVLNCALVFFPMLIILGALLSPYYIPFLADGFSPEKKDLAVNLTLITFPFIALVGIAAIFMGIQNSHEHFFTPAFAPVLFNLGLICGVLFIASYLNSPIYGLALGVLLGGLGQLAFQLPFVKGIFNYHFIFKPADEGIKKLLRMILPAIIGLIVIELNFLVDNKLASRLEDGSISALQYAIRLFQLPLGVFAISIANAILPRLAQQAASKDKEALIHTLQRGVKLCAFIILPAMAGLYVLGKPIIQLLFEHGSFQYQDTLRTLHALHYLLPGMIGYAISYALTKAFYALQDSRTPVGVAAATVTINIIFDYLLVGPMGVGGLALATSIAGLSSMSLLFFLLQRKLNAKLISPIIAELFKMLLSASLMGILTYLFYLWLASLLTSEFLLVGFPILFGLLFYLVLTKFLGFFKVLYRAD